MNLFKKLSALLNTPTTSGERFYPITVRCSRCGELIHTRVDLQNDLSEAYSDDGSTSYICRKVLLGEGSGALCCFQTVEVYLTFNAARRPVDREVIGGVFIEEEEKPV